MHDQLTDEALKPSPDNQSSHRVSQLFFCHVGAKKFYLPPQIERVCQFWLKLIIKFALVLNPITPSSLSLLEATSCHKIFRKIDDERRPTFHSPPMKIKLKVIKFSFIWSCHEMKILSAVRHPNRRKESFCFAMEMKRRRPIRKGLARNWIKSRAMFSSEYSSSRTPKERIIIEFAMA